MFLIWLEEKKELKILTKDVSCKCKCKFDGRKCNSDQKWNNDKYKYKYNVTVKTSHI